LRRRPDTVAKEGQEEAVERQFQVFGNELRVSGVVCGLARVGGREMRHVLDDDVGTLEVCLERGIVVLYFFHAVRVGRHDARALRLVEDGIVGAVDLVAPVDVGGEEPLGLAPFKDLDFVGRGVGAEHEVPVDIVAVGGGAAGMVWGEGEEVEVLVGGDEGGEGGEVGVGGKVGLDECAEGAEGVAGPGVQPEGELREDRRGHVRRLVGAVLPPEHAHRRRTRRPPRAPQRDWETHVGVCHVRPSLSWTPRYVPPRPAPAPLTAAATVQIEAPPHRCTLHRRGHGCRHGALPQCRRRQPLPPRRLAPDVQEAQETDRHQEKVPGGVFRSERQPRRRPHRCHDRRRHSAEA
jgi:hypothetical protein